MKATFSKLYNKSQDEINEIISNFETQGKAFDDRKRNSLKLFEVQGEVVNVKSFKIPHIFNRIAYKFFRSSKAQRSFDYAHKLLQKGINTPLPIAYFEEESFLFGKSYYVSKHLDYDLTYRELCTSGHIYEGNVEILAAFARFTYELHKRGIHFLDHSLGNTLIVVNNAVYDFYLVDLNRMKFGEMDFKTRMNNFARLSHNPRDIAIMAKAYAKESSENEDQVYKAMYEATQSFREKALKKKRLKRILKF